jgi:hypothetical protein
MKGIETSIDFYYFLLCPTNNGNINQIQIGGIKISGGVKNIKPLHYTSIRIKK